MIKRHFWIKTGIITSSLAGAAMVLQFHGTLSVGLLIILFGLLFYPVLRLNSIGNGMSDGLYLIIVFSSLGSVFAVSSPYPVGYADVHKHVFAAEFLISGGHLRELPASISVGFVGLYLIVDQIGKILGLEIPHVARIFPALSYILSVGLFHLILSRPILDKRPAFFATVYFGLNWGVFRFLIEFRTINLAFPLVLVLLAILYRYNNPNVYRSSYVVIFIVVATAAAISHFATFIFYLIMAFGILCTGAFKRRIVGDYRLSIRLLVLLSTVVVITVMIFMNNTLGGATRFVGLQLANLLFDSSAGGSSARGVVGNKFGQVIFLLRWINRFGFILAFLIFVPNWIYNRDQYGLELILTSIIIGIILAASGVIGFALNPSRVFIYFAIPYALILSSGLFSAYNGEFPFNPAKLGSIRKVVFSSLIILMIFSTIFVTPFKLSQDVIGDTQPIRGESQIDQENLMSIDQREISVREFIAIHNINNRDLVYDGITRKGTAGLFFERPDLYRTQTDLPPNILISFSTSDPDSHPHLAKIYTNQDLNIYLLNQSQGGGALTGKPP